MNKLVIIFSLIILINSQQICLNDECPEQKKMCDLDCQNLLSNCTFSCTLLSLGCMYDCVGNNEKAKNLLDCSSEKCLGY